MGCYLEPENYSTIDCIITDSGQRPCRTELMVVRDFNAAYDSLKENAWDKEIVASLSEEGLEYTLANFILCHK